MYPLDRDFVLRTTAILFGLFVALGGQRRPLPQRAAIPRHQ